MKHCWCSYLIFLKFLFGTSGQQCISTPRNTLTLPLDKRSSRARTDLCLLFTLKTLTFPHSEPFFRFLFHIYQLMTRISFSWIKEVNLFFKKKPKKRFAPGDEGLSFETSAFESIYGDQFTLSSHLKKKKTKTERTLRQAAILVSSLRYLWHIQFRLNL